MPDGGYERELWHQSGKCVHRLLNLAPPLGSYCSRQLTVVTDGKAVNQREGALRDFVSSANERWLAHKFFRICPHGSEIAGIRRDYPEKAND